MACSGNVPVGGKPAAPSQAQAFQFDRPRTHWTIQKGQPDAIVRCKEGHGGVRVCIGRRGEIFRDAPPHALLLSQWAPEELTDLWYEGNAFRLIGESGAVYSLDAQATHIVRAFPPPERFRKTVRARDRLLALGGQGSLFQSDDAGASWQTTQLAGDPPFDIAVDAAGRVALLSAPEQIRGSSDSGRSFQPFPLAPVGATALGNDASGRIRVFSVTREPQLLFVESQSMAPPDVERKLRYPTAEYLSAADFSEHRVIEREQKLLVLRKTNHGFASFRGQIGEPLADATPVTGLDCDEIRQVISAQDIFVLCGGAADGDTPTAISIFVSRDGAKHFELVRSDVAQVAKHVVGLGLPADNTLLLSGVSIARSPDFTAANASAEVSKPHGLQLTTDAVAAASRTIYRVTVAQERDPRLAWIATAEPLRIAPLAEPALAMAISPSRKALVIVARREKNRTLTLFRSVDGASGFSAEELVLDHAEMKRARTQEPPSRTTENSQTSPRIRIASAALSNDGVLTLVTKYGDHPTLVTVEPNGIRRTHADAPQGVSQLGATSDGAIAMSNSESRIYESTDLGAEFIPIVTANSRKLCSAKDCSVACVAEGCVLGDGLARVGFGSGAPLIAPFEVKQWSRRVESRNLSGYQCNLDKAGFSSIKGVGPLPSAATAGFRNERFYVLLVDSRRDNVLVATARRDQDSLGLERIFSASRGGNRQAIAHFRNDLGWAVARVAAQLSPSDPLGNVEFRWWDAIGGATHRARVKFTEPVGALVSLISSGARVFSPAAMTPLGSSLFVDLGGEKASRSTRGVLVESNEKSRSVVLSQLPSSAKGTRDFALSQGRVSVAAMDGGASVLTVASEGQLAPKAVTLAQPAQSEAWLGHFGRELGVFVRGPTLRFRQAILDEAVPNGVTVRERAIGMPVPRVACGTAERAERKRYLVAATPEERSRFIVDLGDGSGISLTTARSVAYGNEEASCWEAVEAFDDGRQYVVLLFGDNASTAYLFHKSSADSAESELLWTKLDCHWSEKLEELPAERTEPKGAQPL